MTAMFLHRQYQEVDQVVIPQVAAVEEVDRLLFIGYFLSIFWTLIDDFVANPLCHLKWIPDSESNTGYLIISLSYLIWIAAINIYLAILFHMLSVAFRDRLYKFISCCYVFALVEMFAVWGNPWFRIVGLPMTSNTLIAFGFASRYFQWKKWIQYN